MKEKESIREGEFKSCFASGSEAAPIPVVSESTLPKAPVTPVAPAPPSPSTTTSAAPSRWREISSSLFPRIISSQTRSHKVQSPVTAEPNKHDNETQSKSIRSNPIQNPTNQNAITKNINYNYKNKNKNKKQAENKIDWSLLNKAKISLHHVETTRPRPAATPLPLSQCMEMGLGASSQSSSFRSNKRNMRNDQSLSGKEWRETLNAESEHLPSESSSASAVKGNVTAQLMQCILDREKIHVSPLTADHGVVVVCEEEASVLKLVLWMIDGEFKDKLMMMVLSNYMNRLIGIQAGVTVCLENECHVDCARQWIPSHFVS